MDEATAFMGKSVEENDTLIAAHGGDAVKALKSIQP